MDILIAVTFTRQEIIAVAYGLSTNETMDTNSSWLIL